MKRTDWCGELTAEDAGRNVTLQGWVNRRRDLGGLIFIDLRDRTGLVQAVIEPDNAEAFAAAEKVRSEFVLELSGTVRERPADQQKQGGTGAVELLVSTLTVLSAARTPPFQLDGSVDAGEVSEELRLKHRYLDLRRPEAAAPLKLRHKVSKTIWDVLDAEGFVQVETPLLTLSTPEGARDFVVPSRLQPGSFYALPQSPQLFKQMLMIGGMDRYFQIVRCFRDEDLRADRQPDFTQLDVEMSFVDQEDVLALNELLMSTIVERTLDRKVETPFPRITYQEAMDRYGSDKPDLRFDLQLQDATGLFRNSEFKAFASAIEGGAVTRVLHVPAEQAATVSRKVLAELETRAKQNGAGGLAWLRRSEDSFSGPIAKFLEAELPGLQELAPEGGDLLLFVTADWATACTALGAVRLDLANRLGLTGGNDLNFLWVVDFPLLDTDGEGGWTYMHHPFTMPVTEDLELLETDPGSVRAQAYDLVLNGNEIGGGSIRIHREDIQKRVFAALGFSDEEITEKFGFFVNALSYGTPPHGGVAWGLDRLIMLLAGTDSIRDTIAFPKNQSGGDPLTGAPGRLAAEQLEELGIKVTV